MKRPAARVLRLTGRLTFVGVLSCALALVKNIAMARELRASRADILALEKRERDQRQTLRRLASPAGAIPEIHQKLRLVGPHEEIIFVRPDPSETAGS
jgi:hypothetical protein